MPYNRPGVVIRRAREKRGMLQSELAELAGVSYFQVMRSETGSQYVGEITLRRIKKVLDIK